MLFWGRAIAGDVQGRPIKIQIQTLHQEERERLEIRRIREPTNIKDVMGFDPHFFRGFRDQYRPQKKGEKIRIKRKANR